MSKRLPVPSTKKPKIVFFDIEIIADLDRVMARLFRLYPGATMGANLSTIISFGYKLEGWKKAKCINAWDFPSRWKRDINDDYMVCKKLYEIMKDADGIVGHYSSKFDFKFINARLLYHGFPPLPKVNHVDTCLVARKKLKLSHNRLDDVADFLGCERKMNSEGNDLWVRVANKQKKACKHMSDYCKQDVEVLQQVYHRMLPLMVEVPNYNLFSGQLEERLCPNCGSARMHKCGKRSTKTMTYNRYRCYDCGTYSRTDAKDRLPRTL